MYDAKALKKIFGKFAGREVPMKEEILTHTLGSGRVISSPHITPLNSPDPVMKDIQIEAKKHGLSVRFWWASARGDMGAIPTRLNVTIEKESDGKYRISDKFRIG